MVRRAVLGCAVLRCPVIRRPVVGCAVVDMVAAGAKGTAGRGAAVAEAPVVTGGGTSVVVRATTAGATVAAGWRWLRRRVHRHGHAICKNDEALANELETITVKHE